MYQRLEGVLGKKLDQFPVSKENVMILQDRVAEACRLANMDMEDSKSKKEKKRGPGGPIRKRG